MCKESTSVRITIRSVRASVPLESSSSSLLIGAPGEAIVEQLKTVVSPGDIIIDACNENYDNTERRQELLRPYGAAYVRMGISGGSFGARHAPSLMPSGDQWAADCFIANTDEGCG